MAWKLNKLAAGVAKMESFLPASYHSLGYSFLFNRMVSLLSPNYSRRTVSATLAMGSSLTVRPTTTSQVKLAGTAGINVEEMSTKQAVVSLKNRTKVQNHIGGIHACDMALVSESATGIVVGMNVPDSALPLCKSMKVNFVKRCEGKGREHT